MKKENENSKNGSLPWWTWVVPFIIFYLSGQLSNILMAPCGSLLFYLPIPLGILLIHWWGPRVLLGLLANAIVSTMFWNVDHFTWEPSMFMNEVACAFTSWFGFSYKQKGKVWLPDIYSVVQFIMLGIVIPISVNSAIIFIAAHANHSNIMVHLAMVWTADLASCLAITMPILFFVTPGLERLGIIRPKGSEYVKPTLGFRLARPNRFDIGITFIVLALLTVLLPVEKFWFIHGLFCVYIGVRFGFALSLFANLAVFLFTYVVPYIVPTGSKLSWALEADLLNIHFGMCLLSMTACITGRVISDLKAAEKKLSKQFNELNQTHDELDRFVYSASHDLSAPLKSILGLISVSRLETNPHRYIDIIDKIETSAKRLDGFIKEILDYSRNSRLEKSAELINLRDLVDEVFENFRQNDRTENMEIKILDHQVPQIMTDRMRMKMILNNLISNSIKYKNDYNGNKPYITIQSELNHRYVMIHVKDNGQGIREEYIGKIFNMFFRGVESGGSGLGLYIAKEAAEKLDGKITVNSVYGKGSTFTVYLPKN